MVRKVEVGQKVYGNSFSLFMENKPHINKETVTKVNSTSFYAVVDGTDYEKRYLRKNWELQSVVSNYGKAYESPEEYWSIIEKHQLKKEQQAKVADLLSEATLEKLNKVIDLLKNEVGN